MRTLLIIICSAWLCGLSYAAASAERLSSDEISQLLKGATVETVRGRGDWPLTLTFKADGTLAGKMEHDRRGLVTNEGKWWAAKDGMYCRQWSSSRPWGTGRKKCHFLVLQKDGKTIKLFDRDGDEIKEWVIE